MISFIHWFQTDYRFYVLKVRYVPCMENRRRSLGGVLGKLWSFFWHLNDGRKLKAGEWPGEM